MGLLDTLTSARTKKKGDTWNTVWDNTTVCGLDLTSFVLTSWDHDGGGEGDDKKLEEVADILGAGATKNTVPGI